MKTFGIFVTLVGMFLMMGSPESTAESLTRKSSEGKVTMRVTYENPGKPDPAFSVRMDTHSVGLDSYDLAALSLLRDGKGKEYKGKWTSPEGSGHHRSGVLLFEGVVLNTGKIELIIRDVAGVKERKFNW